MSLLSKYIYMFMVIRNSEILETYLERRLLKPILSLVLLYLILLPAVSFSIEEPMQSIFTYGFPMALALYIVIYLLWNNGRLKYQSVQIPIIGDSEVTYKSEEIPAGKAFLMLPYLPRILDVLRNMYLSNNLLRKRIDQLNNTSDNEYIAFFACDKCIQMNVHIDRSLYAIHEDAILLFGYESDKSLSIINKSTSEIHTTCLFQLAIEVAGGIRPIHYFIKANECDVNDVMHSLAFMIFLTERFLLFKNYVVFI